MKEHHMLKGFSQCNISQEFDANGVKEEMIDMVFPEVPFPPDEIILVFGEEKIRNMVRVHHDYLKRSALNELFPKDEVAYQMLLERTSNFFIEVLGGGKKYSKTYGHPHLRARHFPFTIDENAREIWLMFYKKTLKDVDFPKEYLQAFWEWIESLSLRMINRRTTMEPPKRYPFGKIAHEFKTEEKYKK